MSQAQSYYDGLVAQGYDSQQATEYTKQHYPDFGGVVNAPMPAAANPVPAIAAPAMSVPQPAPMQSTTPMNNNGGEWRILMAESGLKMLLIKIVCILINVSTLFLAVPWTTVLYYNNWAERVVLGGKKLSFTGSAGGFFMVWLKTLFLSTLTLSIYYWLIGRKNVARWVDSSIQWA